MSKKDNWKDILTERLNEVLGDDTQKVIAKKLNMTQGNASKIMRGEQIPITETLVEISKAYGVSIDWLVGLSDSKVVDGLVVEKLTYGEVGELIDYLISNNTIEVPDIIKVAEENGVLNEEYDEDGELIIDRKPIYDPDQLKVLDRVLSFLLRRRILLYKMGPEMECVWRERLENFRELRLLKYNEKYQEAIDISETSGFKDGDWVNLIDRLSKLSDTEIDKMIETLKELKDKEGKENGR